MTSLKECILCFDYLPPAVVCVVCGRCICITCFDYYNDYESKQVNKLVKCTYCHKKYGSNDFHDRDSIIKYGRSLLVNLKNDNSMMDKVNANYRVASAIQNVRNEKINIVNNLPKDIMDIARSIYPKEYEKAMSISAERQQRITDSIKKGKRCFKHGCKGCIFDIGIEGGKTCNTCNDTFCDVCEKVMLDGHKCSEEDLASLRYIEKLSKCPTCKAPVQKVSGCDTLFCPFCKVNFTSHAKADNGVDDGNIDNMVSAYNGTLEVKKETFSDYSLMEEMSNDIPPRYLDFIRNFENNKPREVDLSSLFSYTEAVDLSDEEIIRFVETFTYYEGTMKNNKDYCSKIMKIRKLAKDGNINDETMNSIFS